MVLVFHVVINIDAWLGPGCKFISGFGKSFKCRTVHVLPKLAAGFAQMPHRPAIEPF